MSTTEVTGDQTCNACDVVDVAARERRHLHVLAHWTHRHRHKDMQDEPMGCRGGVRVPAAAMESLHVLQEVEGVMRRAAMCCACSRCSSWSVSEVRIVLHSSLIATCAQVEGG